MCVLHAPSQVAICTSLSSLRAENNMTAFNKNLNLYIFSTLSIIILESFVPTHNKHFKHNTSIIRWVDRWMNRDFPFQQFSVISGRWKFDNKLKKYKFSLSAYSFIFRIMIR